MDSLYSTNHSDTGRYSTDLKPSEVLLVGDTEITVSKRAKLSVSAPENVTIIKRRSATNVTEVDNGTNCNRD